MNTIEDIIFKNLLDNESYMRRVLPFIKEEYFQTKSEKLLFEEIRKYIITYNSAPTIDAIKIELQNLNQLTQKEFDDLSDRLEDLKHVDKADEEWLIDKTETFCKDKAIYNAILESIHIIEGKSKTKSATALPQILSDALSVSFDTHVGHDYFEDGENRFNFYHKIETRMPFDLEYFNDITNGGTPQKTLNVILAGTGVGKSLFMCHHAANCLMQNKNVLYITCEMAEERIAERIDANLMDITLDDLKTLPHDSYMKKLERIYSKISSKLIIKEYPTASANANHFRFLLDELQLKRKFVPDIIFIDYLNICASARFKANGSVNSYTYIKAIAEELRGLAVEKNVPVFTATQTNRQGYCLDLDTKVNTDTGIKCLSELKIGEKVLSNTGYNIVTNIYPIKTTERFKITTKSGKTIICSNDHKFPTVSGEEKSINNGLCIGEKLWIYK